MRTLTWTLLTTMTLGSSIAAADDPSVPATEPAIDPAADPAVVPPAVPAASEPVPESTYHEAESSGSFSDAGETISVTGGASVRGVAEDWMIMPHGLELGSQLKFITSDPSLGDSSLDFSDVAILTLHVRGSVFGKAELYGSVDILPKQPSWTDENVLQGGSVGVRGQIGQHSVAISALASGGPMIQDLGWWGQATAGINARRHIHEIMTFEGALTGLGTYLLPRADSRDPAWLVEAAVTGSVLFHDPDNQFGTWLAIGYSLPVVHKGRDPMTDVTLDPQPRLDLHFGGVIALVKQWDLFADLAVIDRGDMGAMATRLPILDGGFDQRQLVIGLNYHWKEKDEMNAAAMIQR